MPVSICRRYNSYLQRGEETRVDKFRQTANDIRKRSPLHRNRHPSTIAINAPFFFQHRRRRSPFFFTRPGVFDGAQLLRELPSKSLLPSRETRRFGQVPPSGGPTNQRLQLLTIVTAVCFFVPFVGGVQIGQRGQVGKVEVRSGCRIRRSVFYLSWELKSLLL